MNVTTAKRAATNLLLISTILLTGCDAKADGGKNLYKLPFISDIPVKKQFDITVRGTRNISLSLGYQSSSGRPYANLLTTHSPAFIENIVYKTSSLMDSYLRQRGVHTKDCRGVTYNLNVIVLKRSVLQDSSRFRRFFLKKYGQPNIPGGHTMYGFYNSTPEVDNESTILVADISSAMNERIFAHEVAHYLWDRLCLANNFRETSEEFAMSFEDYYMRSLR